MGSNPLYGKFNEMVSALLRPIPPSPPSPPSGVQLRVAVLFPGFDDSLVRRMVDAGAVVVYAHRLGDDREPLDFRDVPVFDALSVALPDDAGKWEEAFGFVLRYLRIRQPGLFFVAGERVAEDVGFLTFAQSKTEPLGYRLEGDGRDVLLGAL